MQALEARGLLDISRSQHFWFFISLSSQSQATILWTWLPRTVYYLVSSLRFVYYLVIVVSTAHITIFLQDTYVILRTWLYFGISFHEVVIFLTKVVLYEYNTLMVHMFYFVRFILIMFEIGEIFHDVTYFDVFLDRNYSRYFYLILALSCESRLFLCMWP